MNILEISNLSKYYGNFTALKEVNLEVPKGSIFGLLGPNGAGKTSLIRIINRITAPDEGSIKFDGGPLQPRHVARIGYLPEERGLYPKMKVGEQLLYLARLKNLSRHEARERVLYWMKRFDMEDWWNKTLEELSKGMAQKVQFITTVVHRPRLLIFDEPFTGFDPVNTELIKNEIRHLRDQGASVIFSTHRMESVEEMCDEIALIHQGEKILDGSLDKLKSAYKSNEYQAELTDYKLPEKLEHSELLSSSENENRLYLQLKARNNDINAIARELMQFGQLSVFRERLPGLSEIFIQKVQG